MISQRVRIIGNTYKWIRGKKSSEVAPQGMLVTPLNILSF